MDSIVEPSTHPGWALTGKLTNEDMALFSRVVRRKAKAVHSLVFILSAVSAFFILKVVDKLDYVEAADSNAAKIFVVELLAFLVVFYLILYFFRPVYNRLYWPIDSPYLSEQTITFSAAGIKTEQENLSGMIRWSGIRDIIQEEKAVYLMISNLQGHVVPYRMLPVDVTPGEFVRVLRAFREGQMK